MDLSLLSLQLRSIKSTRRRTLGSAALWVERSSGRSELSLRAPKPSTADAASTRRSNADDPGSRRPRRLLRPAFVPLRAKRRDGTPRSPAAFTCLYSSPLCCLLVDVGVTRSSLSSVAPFASSMWIQQLLVSIKDPEGWAELPWRVVEQHADRRLCISLNVESCVIWRQQNLRSCMCGGISCVAVHFLFFPVFF